MSLVRNFAAPALLLLTIGAPRPGTAQALAQVPAPLGALAESEENPANEAKIELGRRLFFDVRLSHKNQRSCATCHDPAQGFSNGRRFATGSDGQPTPRHVPSLINVGYCRPLFWDGRSATLEEQALLPIQNPREMNLPLPSLERKLNRAADYRERFQQVFGGPATPRRVAMALAAYQRTIVARDTPFDKYLRGDREALKGPAKRGMELFFGRARCSVCHAGPQLTDNQFHNLGTADPELPDDPGRRGVTGRREDQGAFRTPQLREIGRTAPYMHNGRFRSLLEVVTHYNFGGVSDQANPHRDKNLEVLYLTEDEVADLVAFLETGLTSPPPRSLDRSSAP